MRKKGRREAYSDQRVTQDVERMSNILATNIIPTCLIAPVLIVYYTIRTWQMFVAYCIQLIFRLCSAGWFGVVSTYVYFIIGSIVNRLLLSPISKWAARVEKAEGDFRWVPERNFDYGR